MGGLEHGDVVAQVCARRYANAAHLRGKCVRDVVAIEIERGNHAVLGRAQQNLLQEGICNAVFDGDFFACFGVFKRHPRPAIKQLCAKLALCQRIAPITKTAFGVFHDVALVHQRYAGLVVINGVLDGFAYQTLGTFAAHRLDAYA